MRKLIIALLCVAPGAVPGAAANEDGLTLLRRFLQTAPSVHIVFQQTSLDQNGDAVGESRGRFWHRRPHFFRMEYDPPDGIVMTSDGAQIWTYEPDLRQVVVRSANVPAGASALLDVLSSGDIAALRKEYILISGIGGDLRWARAKARAEDRPIRGIHLGFSADGQLAVVELEDSFGGRARLRVESLSRAAPDDSVFDFVPPAGVDIIREE